VGLRVEEVPVAPLVSRLAPALPLDEGALVGEIRLIGRLREPSTYRGAGEFIVAGGHWGRSELLAPLAGTFNAEALEDFVFDDFFVKFTLGNGVVGIEDLRVGSPDITLAGRGGVNFQGIMRLALRLYVSERAYLAIDSIEKRLPPGYDFGYTSFEGSRERFYRDYLLAGPLQDPLVNFWDPEKAVRAADLKKEAFKIFESLLREEVERSGVRQKVISRDADHRR